GQNVKPARGELRSEPASGGRNGNSDQDGNCRQHKNKIVVPEIKAGTHRGERKQQQPEDKHGMATDGGIPKCGENAHQSQAPEPFGEAQYIREIVRQHSSQQKDSQVLCPRCPFALILRPTLNCQIEKRKCAQKNSGLLHQESNAKRQAAPEEKSWASGFFGVQEQDEPDESRQHDEVSGVSGKSKYRQIRREQGVTRACHSSSPRSE